MSIRNIEAYINIFTRLNMHVGLPGIYTHCTANVRSSFAICRLHFGLCMYLSTVCIFSIWSYFAVLFCAFKVNEHVSISHYKRVLNMEEESGRETVGGASQCLGVLCSCE